MRLFKLYKLYKLYKSKKLCTQKKGRNFQPYYPNILGNFRVNGLLCRPTLICYVLQSRLIKKGMMTNVTSLL